MSVCTFPDLFYAEMAKFCLTHYEEGDGYYGRFFSQYEIVDHLRYNLSPVEIRNELARFWGRLQIANQMLYFYTYRHRNCLDCLTFDEYHVPEDGECYDEDGEPVPFENISLNEFYHRIKRLDYNLSTEGVSFVSQDDRERLMRLKDMAAAEIIGEYHGKY